MNVIESMKTSRKYNDFKPKIFTPHQLTTQLETHKNTLMLCEYLSQNQFPDKTLTKMFVDRDLKRVSEKYSDSEIQDDYKFCQSKLYDAFGECEWAISQRHGFNVDKQAWCISWHFVCLDLFVDYTRIPILLEQKGLSSIFDVAVYKSSEQLWQLPWCHKTPTDKRVLTPIN